MQVTAYQIRGWEERFENAESRKRQHLAWVPVPNSHDSASFRRIMAMEDGPAIYGVWVLLLQVASRLPVRGLLANTEGALDLEDLHFKTGLREADIERALEVLTGPKVGWVERVSGELLLDHAGGPAWHPGRPAWHPDRPADDPGRPADDPGRPADDPGQSADCATNGTPCGCEDLPLPADRPADDPDRPADDPGRPADDPGRPADDPGQPSLNRIEGNRIEQKKDMPTAGAAGPSPWTGKQRQWERWWEAYPRRVGKKKARAAWERAVREVARERGWTDRTADWANRAAEYLQQRVEAFARSPKGQSGEFCPHPTTWLNEGRWDDPPEEWRVAGQEAREHRQAAEHRERFEAVRKVLRQQGLPINREAVQPFQAALSKAAGDVAVQAIRELGGLQWLRALDSHTLDAKRREFVEACLRRGQA